MTNDNPHGYIFAERDSAQWNAAWKALIAAGCNPDEYMLMHGESKGDNVSWGFKCIDTRKYTYVTTY